jgi:protein-disulfide isomerase
MDKKTADKEALKQAIKNELWEEMHTGKADKPATAAFLVNPQVQAVLVILVVIQSFFLGSLWTKMQILEKGGGTQAAAAPAAGTQAAQPTAAAQPSVSMTQIKDAFKKGVLKWGDPNGKLVFVEVTDPSCPYCHIAAGQNGDLNKQAGDQFKLVADGGTYIPPVPEMEKLVKDNKAALVILYTPGHGNGEMGMKSLLCAYDQGKYWEAHNLMYSSTGYDLQNNKVKNDKTKSQDMADFLKSVVDPVALKTCLDNGKYDSVLGTETQLSSGLGISGTPGFYVNSTLFSGAYSFKDMQSAVSTAIGS